MSVEEQLSALMEKYTELQAENERLKALCFRESKVLKEALNREHNKSIIKVVADSLAQYGIEWSLY